MVLSFILRVGWLSPEKSQIRICNFNFHNKRVITLRHIDTDKLHYYLKLHWQINAFILETFPLFAAELKLFYSNCFTRLREASAWLICIMFFKQSHKLLFSHYSEHSLYIFWFFFLQCSICILFYSLVIASKFNAGYSCAIITFLDKCAIMSVFFFLLGFFKQIHYITVQSSNQIFLCKSSFMWIS